MVRGSEECHSGKKVVKKSKALDRERSVNPNSPYSIFLFCSQLCSNFNPFRTPPLSMISSTFFLCGISMCWSLLIPHFYFVFLHFSACFDFFSSSGAVQSGKSKRANTAWLHRARRATCEPHKYTLSAVQFAFTLI